MIAFCLVLHLKEENSCVILSDGYFNNIEQVSSTPVLTKVACSFISEGYSLETS